MLFGMPSLQECKDCAVRFKTEQDSKLFIPFLVRFEILGYYTMHRILRKCRFFRKADMEDLKQTVVVGILRAFKTVRVDERPEYLPLRVSTYVRHELNATYRHLKREDTVDGFENSDSDLASTSASMDPSAQIDVLFFADSDVFSDEDRELLRMKYVYGCTHSEISEKFGGISRHVVKRKLCKLRALVSAHLKVDKKLLFPRADS